MNFGPVSSAMVISATIGAVLASNAGGTAVLLQDSTEIRGAVPGGPGETGQFYFTRAIYSNWSSYGSWRVDYPAADRHFMIGVERLTRVAVFEGEHPVRLDDPGLRRFPFLYAVEVGYMNLTDPEVEGLRNYLLAGGFLVVDDFWGSREWAVFESQIRRVLPGFQIVEISPDHPIMRTFYDIPEIIQVPGFGRGVNGIPTWERDGYVPHLKGIFDQTGRLLVVVNWNTDLGDAWEHADRAEYPLNYSTFAYRLGINFIIYSLTH